MFDFLYFILSQACGNKQKLNMPKEPLLFQISCSERHKWYVSISCKRRFFGKHVWSFWWWGSNVAACWIWNRCWAYLVMLYPYAWCSAETGLLYVMVMYSPLYFVKLLQQCRSSLYHAYGDMENRCTLWIFDIGYYLPSHEVKWHKCNVNYKRMNWDTE